MYSSKAKFKPLIAVIVLVAALIVSTLFVGFKYGESAAADDGNVGTTFYYKELKNSPMAQKFYGVMKEMSEKGNFDSGNYEYDLSSVLTENEIAAYVENSSPKIPVAFGAARDAFYMDHPDLFYIDVYKLYLSAGKQNGKYVAFIGTGNADNYYADNTVGSVADVATVKAKYETEIAKAVAAAKINNADVVTQIKNVNKYIMNNTEYDDGAYQEYLDGKVEYNGYVYSAYGALVEGKAVCSGYARAFKAVMDRLNIPCVLIQGSAYSGKAVVAEGTNEQLKPGLVPHMWNAVEVDGMWYGVDVTYNDSFNNPDRYMLVGDEYLSSTHISDGVISSSGFELKYPALRPLGYGDEVDSSGFSFKDSGKIGNTEFGYFPDSVDPENYMLTLGANYEGKNSKSLAKEGKYLAFRMGDNEIWFGYEAYVEYLSANIDTSNMNVDGYSVLELNWSVSKVQFAVFGVEPNKAIDDGFGGTPVIGYDLESLTEDQLIAVSAVYYNKNYGGYIPAPYVKKMTPNEKGNIQSFEPLKVTVEYSEKLVYEDENNKNVTVTITGKNADLGEKAKTTDVVWNEQTNTLSFTLIPSKYFAHFCDTYNMTPTNLIGEKSRKVPEPANLTFKRKHVVCPKVYNDGRLYMQVFGQPQFVSATDESLNGFSDADGKPIVGDQRSQLMLVVNEPSKAESDEMKNAALDPSNNTGLTSSADIKASSTYEIDLLMCGLVQKVPDGSYMQVGFGFPEGYGPDDAGVTFTVYHYTRNSDGTIKSVETVPCVVTEYGIMATVKSFSPFMICAIDASKAPKYKTLYVNVNEDGGKISNSEIRSFNEGDEYTYTITPDAGYKVDKVTLNGAEQQLEGDKLKIDYSKLNGKNNGNVLEVTFIAERVSAYRAQNNLEIVQPKIVVRQSDMIQAYAPSSPVAPKSESSVVGIVVGVVVAIVVVLIGGCLAFYFVMRKKKAAAANGAPTEKAPVKRAETKSQTRPVASDKPAASARPVAQNKPAPQSRPTQSVNRNTAAPNPNSARNGASSRPVNQSRPASQAGSKTSSSVQPRTPVSRNARPDGNGANGKRPSNDRK